MTRFVCCLSAVVLALIPAFAIGQGVLIDVRPEQGYRLPRSRIWPPYPYPPYPHPHPHPRPRPQPPQSYKIERLTVNANIVDQVAKVQVTQSFVNTGSRQLQVAFVFPLPYDGAVDRMTFMVDGKEYPAKLLSAEEARRIYEGYVRRNRDPALLEWIGTGMFKTSVFPVPPGAKRTVTMSYSQVCRKNGGLTEWLFPLSTAKYTSKPVDKIELNLTLRSQVSIKNVYSPTHGIKIKRPSDTTAKISWTAEHEVPMGDFRLLYDVGKQKVGASLLSYRPNGEGEGFFLLLVSPDIQRAKKKAMRKTVLFVVDRSGSMSGKKIEQAKAALKFVMNNLNEGDLFNIIAYDSTVESFKPELQRYNDKNRGKALGFVEGLYAGGSTNISGAMKTALAQLQDEQSPAYIVFLTDGLPTAGEQNEAKIAVGVRKQNKVRARIFPFGVGYDVNSRLLDKLARVGFGQSEYVRPNEDIETQVAKLYQRISAPVLVDMKIKFAVKGSTSEKGKPVSRVYPKDVRDLFAGNQLVLVGRYRQPGKAKVTISGQVDGQPQSFAFSGKLTKRSEDDSNAFIEKLWAVRRVGEIIDEIDLHGKNQELIDELVALATRHGILTPYTSFLADDNVNVRDVAKTRHRAGVALNALAIESGRSGFNQRRAKGNLQRAQMAPRSGYGSFDRDMSGGMGGAMPATAGRAMSGGGGLFGKPAPSGQALATDRPAARPTVLHIGTKTFFWRKSRWEDSTLTEQQAKEVQKIERFGDTFFKLVNQFGKSAAKYLSIDQPLVVVLNGQAYSFESP